MGINTGDLRFMDLMKKLDRIIELLEKSRPIGGKGTVKVAAHDSGPAAHRLADYICDEDDASHVLQFVFKEFNGRYEIVLMPGTYKLKKHVVIRPWGGVESVDKTQVDKTQVD